MLHRAADRAARASSSVSERSLTGERVVDAPAGGFNPTWQRHVAAYALLRRAAAARARVSTSAAAPATASSCSRRARRSASTSTPTRSRARTARRVVADMRALPFADASFASVLSRPVDRARPRPRAGAGRGRRACSSAGRRRGLRHAQPAHVRPARRDHRPLPLRRVRFRAVAATPRARLRAGGGAGTLRLPQIYGALRRRASPPRSTARSGSPAIAPAAAAPVAPAALRLATGSGPGRGEEPVEITREDFSLGQSDLERALDLVGIATGPAR